MKAINEKQWNRIQHYRGNYQINKNVIIQTQSYGWIILENGKRSDFITSFNELKTFVSKISK
jgi:hypothetical protein